MRSTLNGGRKCPNSVLLTSGLQEVDPGPTLSITHFNKSGRDICANPWSTTSPFVGPSPSPCPCPTHPTPLLIPRRAEEEDRAEEEEEGEEDGCAVLVKQQLYVSSRYIRDSISAVAACRLLWIAIFSDWLTASFRTLQEKYNRCSSGKSKS